MSHDSNSGHTPHHGHHGGAFMALWAVALMVPNLARFLTLFALLWLLK